jgi:hypothetical protein
VEAVGGAGGVAFKSDEALAAEGDNGRAGAGGAQQVPGDGAEARGEVARSFTGGPLGGAEQVDPAEAKQVTGAAGGVGGG